MKLFVRAVVTGFALTLGKVLFEKLAPHVGLADKKDPKADANPEVNAQDGATDPGLRHSPS